MCVSVTKCYLCRSETMSGASLCLSTSLRQGLSLFIPAYTRLAGPQGFSCCVTSSCRRAGVIDMYVTVFNFLCEFWGSELCSLGFHTNHFTHQVISFNYLKIKFKRTINNGKIHSLLLQSIFEVIIWLRFKRI